MGIDSILACLCARLDPKRPILPLSGRSASYSNPHYLVDKKPALVPPPAYSDKPIRKPEQKAADEQAAAKIVAILRNTDKTDAALKAELDHATPVTAAGWSEWLAESIFHALRSALGNKIDGKETNWAVVLTNAYQTAKMTAEDHFSSFLRYAEEHPDEVAAEVAVEVLLSLIAFGILVRMTKWVVRLLGFAELGPVASMSSSPLGAAVFFFCENRKLARG